MEGWVKLHRKILQSDMYRTLNSKQRDVLMTILLMANHKENQWEYKGEIHTAKPGQFVTSVKSIKENCAKDVTEQNIKTTLKKLETWGFLTNKSTKTGRLITVVNWGLYQDTSKETNQDINQDLTENQPTSNQELTTNKNVKNEQECKQQQPREPKPKLIEQKDVVAVQDQFEKIFNLNITPKSAVNLINLSNKHEKTIEDAIEETQTYYKQSGKPKENPYGAVWYAITTGWNINSNVIPIESGRYNLPSEEDIRKQDELEAEMLALMEQRQKKRKGVANV
ncbi:hypothetical protein IC619_015330 [Hazenella sp. IB182353]|uniref:hypothetical protein n=1 Tax=Polycladospora coralii TaxID=2771432 RepID=UPI001746FD89|nr:hypothetical protein [Polycladospora coralii]MBS7531844.1 hypothetical protein [Polycladospora coralii]